MFQHLKQYSNYEDLYDLLTIEECLRHINYSKSQTPTQKSKSTTKKPKPALLELVGEISLYYLKGERYRDREKTIQEWMEKDKEKDRLVESVQPPTNLHCQKCYSTLNFTDKHSHDIDSNHTRVILWYECSKCGKRATYFDNGEQYVSKQRPCKRCGSLMGRKYSRKAEIITTIDKCPNCTYSEKDVWDMKKDDKEWKDKQRKDLILLTKYRQKYCLTPEEGQKYIDHKNNLERFSNTIAERERKEKDPAYQKAMQLKKIGVVELEKLLSEILEKEKYIKLTFDKPEIEKQVIIPFTVQEANTARKEYDSINKLQKLIKKILVDTNWRLMSEGVIYRLGYLSGRLKGYEREDDLMQLVK